MYKHVQPLVAPQFPQFPGLLGYTILYSGKTLAIGDGQPGPNTLRLRQALTDIQTGAAPDPFNWSTPVRS